MKKHTLETYLQYQMDEICSSFLGRFLALPAGFLALGLAPAFEAGAIDAVDDFIFRRRGGRMDLWPSPHFEGTPVHAINL